MSPVSRPRSVRAVQYLLLAAAVAGGLNAVTSPLALIHLQTRAQQLWAHGVPGDWDLWGTVNNVRLVMIGAGVVGALALLAGAVLVRPIGRGRRWARVLGWVAAAVITLGDLVNMATDSDQFPIADSHEPGAAMMNSLLPGWYLPVYYTAEIVCWAAMLAVAWLLIFRGAGRFFEASTPPSPAAEDRVWDLSRVRRNTVDGR